MKSFIGLSVLVHFVVIGLILSSYLFSNPPALANNYNMADSIKIELGNINIPNLPANEQNDEIIDEEEPIDEIHDEDEAQTERIEPESPIEEVKKEAEEERLKEDILKEEIKLPEEQAENSDAIIAETEPVEKQEVKPTPEQKVKKEKQTVTDKKTVIQKETIKKDQQIVKKTTTKEDDQNDKTIDESAESSSSSASSSNQSNNAVLIKAIHPQYPKQALDKRIEGFVVVSYDVNHFGATENIRIIEAQPNNVFNRSVIMAIRQWKYHPTSVKNLMIKFVFDRNEKQIKLETASL